MPNSKTTSVKPNHPGRLYLLAIILIVLSLACSLPSLRGSKADETAEATLVATTPPKPTATPQPLPPALVESSPPQGGELPLQGPIILYFNQDMDQTSVEAALSKQLNQEASFTWPNDRTVEIFINASLQPNSSLELSLGEESRSAQGMALFQPVSLQYKTSGYLRIAQTLPEPEAVDVDPSSAIVAAFNRPVVPLGADPLTLSPAFSLDPPAMGRGEWINTSTYIFYPEPALEGGKSYSVQIDPGLKSTSGGPLEEVIDWRFTTAPPRLLSLEPGTDDYWPLDPEITLTFNQPMNTSSVEANFTLLAADGSPVAGSGEWNQDYSQFTFKPDNLLSRNSSYSVRISGSTQAQGGTALGQDTAVSAVTYPALGVLQSNPTQGGQLASYAGPMIYFNAPLDPEDISDYIQVTPKISNLNTWFNEESLSLNINGDFEPSTDYTLTISPDLRDSWGGRLGQTYQLIFTSAPARPDLTIVSPSEAVFVKTDENSLTAQVTNVFNAPIRLGSVPLADFIAMQGINGYEMVNAYRSFDQTSWVQSLDITPNTSQQVPIYLQPNQGTLAAGLYLLRVDLEQYNANTRSKLLVVSDVQITLKASATDALVWAVDVNDGRPLSDQTVMLYDEENNLLDSGQTDAEGLFYSTYDAPVEDPYRTMYAVIGQPGQANFGFASSSWSAGIQPWDFQIPFRSQAPGLKVYLYSDRPIYRPGQTIYFRAVARQSYNGRYDLPDISNLPLTLNGDQGEIFNTKLALSAFGTAHGEIILPQDTQPGYYVLSSPEVDQSGDILIQVANYRKPEINLQVSFDQAEIQAGEALKATVDARYFFDAPAGNMDVNWTLYKQNATFSLPGYRVGPENNDWLLAFRMPDFGTFGQLVEEGQGQTGPDGTLALEFPTESEQGLVRYSLEITAQDESGLPVSARSQASVHPADFYIGLKPDSWVGRAGQASGFEVYVVNWDKEPAGERVLSAEFRKVVWERREREDEEYLGPEFVPVYTPVASTDFVTSQGGAARLSFTPPDAGTYQLAVYDPSAPTGEGTRTEMIVWVSGPSRAIWPSIPNARIKLSSDRENYLPGEMAQVFIPNPFGRAVQALVTVERAIIMEYRLIEVGAGGHTLELPLNEEHAPNVFLSVTLLGPNEDGETDFRQGFVELTVEPIAQTLNVQLTGQPERAGPGDQVHFEVLVTDSAGDPIQGQFSLSLVDLAVLALADPNSIPIEEAFYGRQPSGVRTALSLAASANRLIYGPLGLGGGGGGAEPPVIREDFPDTAYWNAEIVTGADGKAEVTINLPDSLTTWQVDMRGLTLDTLVGDASTQVITSKTLLVRPVTPRFLVAGDHVLLAAVVQNNSSETINVEAGLQASGVTLEGDGMQQASIPAGGRLRFEWWGIALDEGSADLVFSAQGTSDSGESYTDAARPALGALPILRFTARQAFQTAGVLDTAGEIMELVSLPASFDPTQGQLQVELAPSLASAMLSGLAVLRASPYDSTEETVSRFLPNLETYRTLTRFGIEADALPGELESEVDAALAKLTAGQNEDGGWGWWPENDSDPYISAYGLFGLNRAQAAGFTVDPETLQRGVDYLKITQDPGAQVAKWELDRLAFAQYVLAGYQAAQSQAVYGLFERRAELSPWARALLALTLEQLTPGSEEAKTLMGEIGSAAIRSASGAFWEFSQDEAGLLAAQLNMHSDLSNSAVVVYALAQRDPGSPLLADAVRYLMANRGADGAWSSTYGTAWSLLALNGVMAGTAELGGDYSFAATLNHDPLLEGQAGGSGQLTPAAAETPIQSLYPDYPNALRIRRDAGQGRLYYNVGLLVGRPVDQVAPLSQGLSIERSYHPSGEACSQDDCPAIRSAQAGERVTVRLTLSLPHDMHYLVVEDYIPAGTEILDISLKTSQQGEFGEPQEVVLFDPRRPFSQGWGWWLFNAARIFDDHIAWTADYLPAGTYQLAYTLVTLQPGRYHALPSRAWLYYFSDVQANSAGDVFEVK